MDISKARIYGPLTIVVDGVNIGHVLDGVDFTAERDFEMVKVDKAGETPIDYVLTGNRLFAEFKLAQPDWYQLNFAIPETSSYDGAASADRADFGADAGASLRSEGKQVTFHPTKRVATDKTDDFVIYKAVSIETVAVPLKINEQQLIGVKLSALYVEDYGTGRRLGHYGPADVS